MFFVFYFCNLQMLDLLADVMTFGALLVCAECGGKGQLVYKTGVGYECTGSLSEWTKCPATTRQPPAAALAPSESAARCSTSTSRSVSS